nr:WAT1-related protein At2g39510-like [Ipomoea batatas]
MMRNERVVKWLNGAKPYLGVAFLQLSNVGSAIISKLALNQGMNPFTFTVYRNVIAAGFFAPLALIFEWLENVKIKRLHTQAKIVGTTSTIGGAMIMTLVKGPTMVLPWTKHSKNIVSYSSQHVVNQHTDYIKAALLLTACCCCISCSRIGQAIMLKSYPAALSLIALICMAGAVQSTIFTLILERGNASVWSLHWDMRLFTYVYHGLLRSGTEYYISVIVMKMRGPVFVTAFNPLCMVIVAIVGSFLLSEKLYLGRVLGAVVIVVGLGLVLWGKSKDQTSSDNHSRTSTSNST